MDALKVVSAWGRVVVEFSCGGRKVRYDINVGFV